jgi:hypothetical protein
VLIIEGANKLAIVVALTNDLVLTYPGLPRFSKIFDSLHPLTFSFMTYPLSEPPEVYGLFVEIPSID